MIYTKCHRKVLTHLQTHASGLKSNFCLLLKLTPVCCQLNLENPYSSLHFQFQTLRNQLKFYSLSLANLYANEDYFKFLHFNLNKN